MANNDNDASKHKEGLDASIQAILPHISRMRENATALLKMGRTNGDPGLVLASSAILRTIGVTSAAMNKIRRTKVEPIPVPDYVQTYEDKVAWIEARRRIGVVDADRVHKIWLSMVGDE